MKRVLWMTATGIWIVVGIVSSVAALFAPMLFDAPGTDKNPRVQALALAIVATPVLCLLGAWLPWAFMRRKFAAWLFLLPLLSISSIIILDQF